MSAQIAELVNSKWLIHHEAILGYIPSFISYINGNQMAIQPDPAVLAKKKPFVIAKAGDINLVTRWDLEDQNLPELSVAVIPIQGALTSYNTMNLATYVQQAEAHPNIISILFLINTPGGMVFYTDICTNIIKNCSKPTIGFVLQMCASAGMWLASAMDYRIVSSELDRIGSIGVMTSVSNLNTFLKEKLGIDIEEIYATKSENKNLQWKEFLKGNFKPIVEDLDYTNEIFHQTIITNLGIDKDSPVFKGDTYFAKEAIKLGLANEINTIDYAIQYAITEGYKSSF